MKKLLGSLIALALLASPIAAALAQTYPSSQPIYNPTPVLTQQSIAAAAAPTTVRFVTQGLGSVTYRLSGTYTGLSATFQGSNDPVSAASPTWTALPATPITGGTSIFGLTSATTTGAWRLDVSGYTMVRLNVTALSTGTLLVNAAGGQPESPRLANSYNSGALLTLTAQTFSTQSSADIDAGDNRGGICYYNQSAHTGSPAIVVVIQNKDPVSGNYTEVGRSNASSSDQLFPLTVYPGTAAVSGVVLAGVLGSKWRCQVIIASGTSTGILNADVLR